MSRESQQPAGRPRTATKKAAAVRAANYPRRAAASGIRKTRAPGKTQSGQRVSEDSRTFGGRLL